MKIFVLKPLVVGKLSLFSGGLKGLRVVVLDVSHWTLNHGPLILFFHRFFVLERKKGRFLFQVAMVSSSFIPYNKEPSIYCILH